VDDDSLVVDYYSGVGVIGLSLANRVQKLALVESDDNAINLALQNIQNNKIADCQVKKGNAEELLDSITRSRTVIFDPPRAGLDDMIIRRILDQKPIKIIYLSCDPATQARDCAKLKEFYKVKFIRLYNFFPRTPHVEALWVLELK
jgi:23S rRNA (uracil1939-C5)-methyltransferase